MTGGTRARCGSPAQARERDAVGVTALRARTSHACMGTLSLRVEEARSGPKGSRRTVSARKASRGRVPGAASHALTWASRAGRGGGRLGRRWARAPHGPAPGPPGWRADRRGRRVLRLGLFTALAFSFPPTEERRRRSRAAGWRGRIPGSGGCGTRRGSAAPASGPTPWVAPWDAETPCCAAGRTGSGLGSGVPPEGERQLGPRGGGERGKRAPRVGGVRVRGKRERPRAPGDRGSRLEGRRADPVTRRETPARTQQPRRAANAGRARRDLRSPSPDAQLRVRKLLHRFLPPAPCGKQEPVIRRAPPGPAPS